MKTIASLSRHKVVRQLKDNCTQSNKEEPINSITDGERNLQKLVSNGSQRKAEPPFKEQFSKQLTCATMLFGSLKVMLLPGCKRCSLTACTAEIVVERCTKAEAAVVYRTKTHKDSSTKVCKKIKCHLINLVRIRMYLSSLSRMNGSAWFAQSSWSKVCLECLIIPIFSQCKKGKTQTFPSKRPYLFSFSSRLVWFYQLADKLQKR